MAQVLYSYSGGIASPILVNNYALTDTSVHSYRTDPSYFFLVRVPDGARAFSVWVYNSTNQTVTVQAIGNVDTTETYPDYNLGSSFSVASGAAVPAQFSVDQLVTPFLGVQVSAATAPTSGAVYALLIVSR